MNTMIRWKKAAVLGTLALLISAGPLTAQRGRRADRPRPRPHPVTVRTDFGAFAVTDRGVVFRSPHVRAAVMLRAYERRHPRAFRRLMAAHRALHRDMSRMHPHRARRVHARWHARMGFSHRDLVRYQHRRGHRHFR